MALFFFLSTALLPLDALADAAADPGMSEALPVLCVDPPGIDRGALHAQINADAVGFFRETLAPR